MKRATLAAFHDELEKISSELSEEVNKLFGLPLHAPKRGKRQYEQGAVAGSPQADRSQAPISGQSTADIASGNTMSPASGPGGV